MTSTLNTYEVETNKVAEENVESYSYGENHLIHWTDTFGYTITDFSGKIVIQGKLQGEEVGDNLPFTFLNCYWFTQMGNDLFNMLYVSFTGGETANLKTVNLKTGESAVWASGLTIKRSYFHNFCWLHYNAESDTVQLGYSTEDKCMYYNKVKKGAAADEAHQVPVSNPNIFFAEKNNLMISCNFKESNTSDMFYLHPDGFTKITAKFESTVTLQDFGFCGENLWYFIGIEGAAGKSKIHEDGRGHTSVIFLYDLAGNSWASHKEELTEAEMKLHFLDDAVNTKEGGNGQVDMIDGFSMLSNVGGQIMISSTCSNHKLVSWTVTKDEGGQWVVNKHPNSVDRSEKNYEVSTWNRKRLYTWSFHESTPNKIVIDFHNSINEKLQYLYFLQQLVGPDSKWQPQDLWKAVAILKGK